MTILSELKTVIIGYDDGTEAFNDELLLHLSNAVGDLLEIEAVLPTDDLANVEYAHILKPTTDAAYPHLVKQYIYTSVKLGFDPPAVSSLTTLLDNKRKELIYRLTYLKTEEGGTEGGR